MCPGFRGQWSVHLGQKEMLVCPVCSEFLEDLVNSFPHKHIQISLPYLKSLRECLLLVPLMPWKDRDTLDHPCREES